jgi:hypothetical protein
MSGEHGGQDHPQPKRPENRFDRTRLPNIIMQDVRDDVRCMWEYTVMLEKCCVHMPCSLNDQNDLILQLVQVPVVSYSALNKDWCNKTLLADCTPHSAFCRLEWRLFYSMWIFRGPEPRVFLFTHPSRWNSDLSLNHRQSVSQSV